eukprot:COSAG06_NODE_49573_length_324_cov_1.142222_1_plen_105_part_10
MISWPRQAQDKHRETLKKRCVVLQNPTTLTNRECGMLTSANTPTPFCSFVSTLCLCFKLKRDDLSRQAQDTNVRESAQQRDCVLFPLAHSLHGRGVGEPPAHALR